MECYPILQITNWDKLKLVKNGLLWSTIGSQDSSIVKKLGYCILRIAGSSLTADKVFFWYGPLASLSLQIASVASEQHGKNNRGPNQWIIRVKITPRLLKIHLSLLVKSS